ncbi:hypothetical protein RB623_29150 [Mesorhizobium sp. LHD-90]|uniref:hypothetical protein n=1 Tax=Mesorhizobium sp. LHD-90 TaxID=3071414 RepID=UPI0027E1D217|nr:hypothetical protein [Mesorhizobium sp. LHD-90]MDQ6438140.1 hypothetical protein [Mesorhizobium sp. LHD-90]
MPAHRLSDKPLSNRERQARWRAKRRAKKAARMAVARWWPEELLPISALIERSGEVEKAPEPEILKR